MKKIALVALIGIATAGAAQAETFFCTAEAAGGLKYIDGNWVGVSFNVRDQQFIVSNSLNDPGFYRVTKTVDGSAEFGCKKSKYPELKPGEIECVGWGSDNTMTIDLKELRFTEIHVHGFHTSDTPGEDMSYITGGKCARIDPK